jgi:two-component system alkaline phosphatase synthesis response regulator PhoP
MIVDDEPDVVEVFKKILGCEGYSIVCAQRGEECLSKLKNTPVDLILMDFFMPGMDGRRVIEEIRKIPNLKDTKIAILTSALFKKRGIEIIKELNVLDYITKPIDLEDFTLRIKNDT